MEDTLSIPQSEYYSIISLHVAIGNIHAPYESFDVIINLAYPNNNAERNKMNINIIGDKMIIHVGIYDNEDEKMLEILYIIIPKLIIHTKLNPNHKLLFHCHAGISRSATILIAYLSKLWNLPYNIILDYIKDIRPIIKPNHGFMTALSEYLKK